MCKVGCVFAKLFFEFVCCRFFKNNALLKYCPYFWYLHKWKLINKYILKFYGLNCR